MSSFMRTARADINRCLSDDASLGWRVLGAVRREVGLQAVLVYRFGRLLESGRKFTVVWPLLPFGWLLYALAALLVRKCYGVFLAQTADIGAGFYVGHFGGVEVVNCRIGERCSVGQQTKVGRATDRDGPQIGNGVWIGAHAKIFGAIRIGDGATIAPGARVIKDVPSRTLVVGDPARVVFRNYDNSAILPGVLGDSA
jgi:serine O-acetyltransferase